MGMSGTVTWACRELESKKEKLGIGIWKVGLGFYSFIMGIWNLDMGSWFLGMGIWFLGFGFGFWESLLGLDWV